MPTWLLALVLGIGGAAYVYNFLAKHNGNADPKSNALIASVAGFILFLILLSLMKLVLNFQ
jgi:hypothetical protein